MHARRCIAGTGHVDAIFERTDGAAVDVLVCPAMPSPPDTAWGGGPDLRALQPELIASDTFDVIETATGPYLSLPVNLCPCYVFRSR